MIRFFCPACTLALKTDSGKAGKQGFCPRCKSPFVVPPATDAPAPNGPETTEPVPPLLPNTVAASAPEDSYVSPIVDEPWDDDLEQEWDYTARQRRRTILIGSLLTAAFICGSAILIYVACSKGDKRRPTRASDRHTASVWPRRDRSKSGQASAKSRLKSTGKKTSGELPGARLRYRVQLSSHDRNLTCSLASNLDQQ